MKSNQYLEHKIKEIVSRVEPSISTSGDIDTCSISYELAFTSEWGEAEFERVDFLSKRLDISKKLFVGYLSNGRKAVDTEVTDELYLELVVAILFKAVLLSMEDDPVDTCLKRFNVLFKSMDIINPAWLLPESELGIELLLVWQKLQKIVNCNATNGLKISYPSKEVRNDNQVTTAIPLTVLFYEGPIARAYLATIKSLGLRPQKIIELVSEKDVATKKTVGKWLPQGLRTAYAAIIQRNKIHYWPKWLLKTKPDFINNIFLEVQNKFGFKKEDIDNANSLSPLSDYSDCVEVLLVDGLSDKRLYQYISEETSGAILFTGGGIISAELLSLEHVKFLHIHPGFLPNIRGADCALWSTLLTGHTSATCFYMSPGIDTGDIISPHWLPALSFDVNVASLDIQSMYRAVYSFLDPWIRAFVLRDMIHSNTEFYTLVSEPQSEDKGTTFHFMHQQLREVALKKLIK